MSQLRLRLLLTALVALATAGNAFAAGSVVVSQVYGGGGNTGATLRNDFVELYNRTSAPVSLDGWSVQYASTAGTTWQRTPLSGTIAPGGYYLVQQAAGAGGSVDLPAPDVVGGIAMSASAGKVVLSNANVTLSGSCPTDGVVDLVGYGSATNCFETAPTANLGNTSAALRNGNGATDTDSNAADFTIGAPNPRNSGAAETPPPVLVFGTCFDDGETPISAIQGAGTSTPAAGQQRVIEGVVVGDYQRNESFRGYFVQEEAADQDADPATSEGVFVFSGSNVDNVSRGDLVRVRGTVSEFGGMTQLSSVTELAVCGTGSVPATDVALPVESVDFLERYEGMLVSFAQTLTVTEVFGLGRFGEVSLSGAGRLYHPTAVAAPGPDSLAVDADNDRSRIILDDGDNRQNIDPTVYPQGGLSATNTLRVGDTLAGLTGVLEFRFSAYRIQPVGAVEFLHTNPRPAAPAAVGGNLKVASFNVLNYFNTFCADTSICRGANGPRAAEEFERQKAKIVSALTAIDADVVGLMEIENDADPDSALADLTAALNAAAGAGTYAYVDTGVIGTDAIKVALLYKPAKVSPVGAWETLTSADDPRFLDTRSRPALAQTFRHLSSGEVLTVAVNHLKSKGSGCGGAPDDQPDALGGNCNGTRTLAAEALADWLNGDPTGSGDPDVLIIGDLNAYTFEAPIQALEERGYTNLIRQFQGLSAYSYVFRGESGYLDHALANASLRTQVAGVTEWHINPDEPTVLDYNLEFRTANHQTSLYDSGPYRSSDHDPVIVGLQLNHAPTASAGGPYTVSEGGSVAIAATAADADGDTLTYAWDLDGDGAFDDAAGAEATFSAAAIDGPATRTVRVRVSDAVTSTIASAAVTVTNVAPTAAFGAPPSAFAGLAFTLALTGATDAAPADVPGLQYAFDCGGGYGAFASATAAACVSTATGLLEVGARVRDDDGGVTEYRATVRLTVTFASLCELVGAYADREGVAAALCAKLDAAASKADRAEREADLHAFVNQVEAQSGKALTNDEAATLIRLAAAL